MPFEVVWTERSKKDLKLIDRATALRIAARVEALEKYDNPFLEKIRGTSYYKFRVGDYRIVVDKFPATKKLFILRVGHRRNIYKNIR